MVEVLSSQTAITRRAAGLTSRDLTTWLHLRRQLRHHCFTSYLQYKHDEADARADDITSADVPEDSISDV